MRANQIMPLNGFHYEILEIHVESGDPAGATNKHVVTMTVSKLTDDTLRPLEDRCQT